MHVIGVQSPYGNPHVPVDVSQVLVLVATAAFAIDAVHDSVDEPEHERTTESTIQLLPEL